MTRCVLCLAVVLLCSIGAFAQQKGTLNVTSFPTGAQVTIDGVLSNKETPMSIKLTVGVHTVTVSAPNSGWTPETRTVTIIKGDNDLSITLLPTLTAGPQGSAGPQGPAGSQGPQGDPGPPGSGGEETVVIQQDHFNEGFLDTAEWISSTNDGSCIRFESNYLQMFTTNCANENIGEGIATLRGTRQFSVNDGALVFKTRAIDIYVDGAVYGNLQPRGLVNGDNRNNAIEFISMGGSLVACRTVSGGTATETTVDIGQNLRLSHVYQIVAKPNEVKFYVNGALKCTHTTNIPTAPLNLYFSTSDSSAANVPVMFDWVSFERRPN